MRIEVKSGNWIKIDVGLIVLYNVDTVRPGCNATRIDKCGEFGIIETRFN